MAFCQYFPCLLHRELIFHNSSETVSWAIENGFIEKVFIKFHFSQTVLNVVNIPAYLRALPVHFSSMIDDRHNILGENALNEAGTSWLAFSTPYYYSSMLSIKFSLFRLPLLD